LALLWRGAHPDTQHALFLARAGALSVPLDHKRSWGECAAAGYRACGRIAVRIDIVEKLAEAVSAEASDAALARLIGRPTRDLASVLHSLGYSRKSESEGARPRWRPAPPRPKRQAPAKDNAFSALANLLPPTDQAPPRRRRSSPA
jgi:hypothetical protein